MPRSSLIESEQRTGSGPRSECAAHAMRAPRCRGKRVSIERVVHARGDVVAENDSPDEQFATRVLAFGHSERRRYDRAAGVAARRRMGIVAFIRVRQHAVGKGCMDRAGQQSRSHNRRLPRAAEFCHIVDGQSPRSQVGSRYHGGHSVEDVLAGFFHHGRRKRLRECIRDVSAEPARRRTDLQ